MQKIVEECSNCLKNRNSVFSVLTPEERKYLLQHHTCYRYCEGDFIFHEGDKPTGLVSLSEGKVKIFREGIGGREQIVRMAKPIGFLGYRALFANERHIASAVAIEDSVACIIPKDDLYKIIRSNSDFALNIIKSFATELGFSNIRTVTLTQKHIRGRLAESLISLKDTYGFEKDGITLKIQLSREDIASYSNMTTSNAIRTLSAFADEKIIFLNGRKIAILDMNKLEKISNMG